MPGAPDDTGSAATAAAREAAAAARATWGRMVAYLAWQWRDLAAAEDALAQAFQSALEAWPASGVPASPEGWLMAAAKRNMLHAARHARVEADPAVLAVLAQDEAAPEPEAFPDQRLKLLFVCAHPAIDSSVHTALMLQAVLGLDARRIAQAFLVSPAAMAQRLVRAKAKIALAGIRFEEPGAAELPERIEAVLEAIYAAYGLAWEDGGMAVADRVELAGEARYLAELAHALLPQSAEAAGLLALVLLCDARREARMAGGGFVPLHRQDAALWDLDLIRRADALLARASGLRAPGRFQLEAAIQAAHCHRAFTGTVPWPAITQLYAALVHVAPSLGARVGQAVALAEAGRLADSAAVLDALAARERMTMHSYQPYWVARAHLAGRRGDPAGAVDAYRAAIGLTTAPAVRAYLQEQLASVSFCGGSPPAPA